MLDQFITALAKSIKAPKGLQTGLDEFSEAAWQWVRPIFLKDDKPLIYLQDQPEDTDNQQLVKLTIKNHLKEHPEKEAELKVIMEKLPANSNDSTNSSTIIGDNNVNVQGTTGSTINIGRKPD